MTSSTPMSEGLARPLPDLAAWTNHFRRAEIPVLRETIDALDALRAERRTHRRQQHRRDDRRRSVDDVEGAGVRGEHRGRTVVTGAETVISALVMMGIPPFFRTFAEPVAVEDRLACSPDALAGVQRVLRRAHRGARFALAFAIHRTDPDAASIHAAALLHEFAEMLLWCHAPRLALAHPGAAGRRSDAAIERRPEGRPAHRARRVAAGARRGVAAARPALREGAGAARRQRRRPHGGARRTAGAPRRQRLGQRGGAGRHRRDRPVPQPLPCGRARAGDRRRPRIGPSDQAALCAAPITSSNTAR